jgi:hypothetical protein
VRVAAWRLLSLNNWVAASAVNAALRSRLAAWKGELRGAIAAADAALVCKLFLEFLSGLVEGNLRSCAEKECVAIALDKLRGGGTRAASAHHLAAADLGLLVNRCWSEFGERARQRRETSSKRRAPYLLEKRRQIHKRSEDHVHEWNSTWDRVPRSWARPRRPGAVTLPTAPLLALDELRELRRRGVAALSLTTPQVTTARSTATTPHTPARPALTAHAHAHAAGACRWSRAVSDRRVRATALVDHVHALAALRIARLHRCVPRHRDGRHRPPQSRDDVVSRPRAHRPAQPKRADGRPDAAARRCRAVGGASRQTDR